MLQSIVNAFLGCAHRRTTFPLTPGRRQSVAPGSARHGTYVACLDCGKEFAYDWQEMRVGNVVASRVTATTTESYSPVNR